MAKPMPAPAVLRATVKLGALPPDALVSRTGEARWECRGLAHLAWVSKSPEGALTWHVNVGDAKFGPTLEKYGSMSVPVRAAQNSIAWPAEISDELESFLRNGVGAASEFVSDRADLCFILSSDGDVVRGGLHAWLPVANYPARLVQALILAQDLESDEMQRLIREKLASGPIRLSNGRSLDIGKSAQGWASKYSDALGVRIVI